MNNWKPLTASKASMRITNPIRDIVDQLKIPENPSKELISLSIGNFLNNFYYSFLKKKKVILQYLAI